MSHVPSATETERTSDQSNLRFYAENAIFVLLTGYFTWERIAAIYDLIQKDLAGTAGTYFRYQLINGFVFLFFNIMLIVAFLTRSKPKVQAASFQETVIPIISSYFIIFYNLPGVPHGPMDILKPYMIPLSWIGYILAVFGGIFGIYAINHLRRSFAIFADVRDIVTTGPYGKVRHPLYIAESLVILGVGFTSPNLIFAAILVAHIATLYWRAGIEERKLAAHSETYRKYMRTTGRFFPKFQ